MMAKYPISADFDPVVVGYRPAFKELIAAVLAFLEGGSSLDELASDLDEACRIDLAGS